MRENERKVRGERQKSTHRREKINMKKDTKNNITFGRKGKKVISGRPNLISGGGRTLAPQCFAFLAKCASPVLERHYYKRICCLPLLLPRARDGGKKTLTRIKRGRSKSKLEIQMLLHEPGRD